MKKVFHSQDEFRVVQGFQLVINQMTEILECWVQTPYNRINYAIRILIFFVYHLINFIIIIKVIFPRTFSKLDIGLSQLTVSLEEFDDERSEEILLEIEDD